MLEPCSGFARTMKIIALSSSVVASVAPAFAGNTNSQMQIQVDCANPTVELSPHLYGLFFEDINYSADGGIYAELVQNRSFEYYKTHNATMPPLYAWEKVERDGAKCYLAVESSDPLNEKNTNYLQIEIDNSGTAAGVANTGFDGIPLDAGSSYDISLYARNKDWSGSTTLTIALELEDGTVCGKKEFSRIGNNWNKFEGVITSDKTTDNARLVITTSGKGELDLDMVSLFPQDTFMGRKNGMRKDLAQALKDLHPKFLRFPGGCIVHGNGVDNIYRWKDTVGDIAERKPNWNRWGYHQTYGLGYYEYLQLCEDIGATPLPVIPVGVSCGFTRPQECVPMDELGPWIQDALDLVEFCNGPVDSKWGGLRAKMGHPESFNLEFLAIGNEPHDNALFRDRFPLFVKAMREAHPEIKIVGTSGLGPRIPIYNLMTEQKVYSSDEHYYENPEWFLANTHRFDNFDRSKPKIFVGEYASRDKRLFNAIAEAAFLTGIERNGDMVDMTCYAPLLANVKHTQWNPDLIYFDHRTVVKTPSYYVQQLFAANKGDVYLANEIKIPENQVKPTLAGSVGVGSWNTAIEVDEVRVNGKQLATSMWQTNGGNFQMKNGNYVQSDTSASPAVSLSKEQYDGQTVTYTVRARKTGGDEGFLIVFGNKDGRKYWWNVGGWGNTRNALQQVEGNSSPILTEAPGKIENNTWYDLKVVLSPGNIKCYLDDKLIHNYDIPEPSLSIAATLDKKTNEVIVKLINPTSDAVDANINLNGVSRVAPQGQLLRLAGSAGAMNTIDNPDAIKTETSTIKVGKQFNYTLPPMSVQFIRVKVK